MTSQAVHGTLSSGANGLILQSMWWGNWVQVLVLCKRDQTTDPHGQKEHTNGQFDKIFTSVIHRLKHKLLSKRQL